jgi:hypothetical protein
VSPLAVCNGTAESRLVVHHRVRTDRLVTVRVSEGVTPRLLLTDASGGHLVSGMPLLEQLGRRIDDEVCRAILRRSGMERA